jgi:hypothetical protein
VRMTGICALAVLFGCPAFAVEPAAPVVLGASPAAVAGAPKTLADIARERKLNRTGTAVKGSFSATASTVVQDDGGWAALKTAPTRQNTVPARAAGAEVGSYAAYLELASTKAAIALDQVAPLAGARGRVMTEAQHATGNLNGRPSAPGQLSDGLGNGNFVPSKN